MINFNDMSWLNGVISPSGLPIAPTGNLLSGPGMPSTQNSWNGSQFIMPHVAQAVGGGTTGGILAPPPGTALYQAPPPTNTQNPQGFISHGRWGGGGGGRRFSGQQSNIPGVTTNYQSTDPNSWLSLMSALAQTNK